jgi:PEP-CTERM motif
LKRFVLLFAGLLLVTSSAFAGSYSWDFSNPTGTLGTSQNYFANGVKIVAYGFDSTNTGIKLFGKNGGGDENGVGIAGGADNEIQVGQYIQLDMTAVAALHPTTATLGVGSVQAGETWSLYGSNSKGSKGTVLIANSGLDYPGTVNIASYLSTYSYLSVGATNQDVLVSAISATTPNSQVPEPASMFLLGSGALALLGRRKKNKS